MNIYNYNRYIHRCINKQFQEIICLISSAIFLQCYRWLHRRTGLQNLGGGGGDERGTPDERGTRENS